jgi:hypothetical protein
VHCNLALGDPSVITLINNVTEVDEFPKASAWQWEVRQFTVLLIARDISVFLDPLRQQSISKRTIELIGKKEE